MRLGDRVLSYSPLGMCGGPGELTGGVRTGSMGRVTGSWRNPRKAKSALSRGGCPAVGGAQRGQHDGKYAQRGSRGGRGCGVVGFNLHSEEKKAENRVLKPWLLLAQMRKKPRSRSPEVPCPSKLDGLSAKD